MAIAAFLVLPWLGIDMSPMQPAKAMAQFFGDSFQRRVGAPLSIVTGDPRIAAMVSLAPSRPHLYLDATPQRSPWVTADDVKTKGAIVVWPNSGIAGAPPPAHRGALPRPGPGSAAHLRASGAGRAPAAADRLGADPAAIGPGRSESRTRRSGMRNRRATFSPTRWRGALPRVRLSDSSRPRAPCRERTNR